MGPRSLRGQVAHQTQVMRKSEQDPGEAKTRISEGQTHGSVQNVCRWGGRRWVQVRKTQSRANAKGWNHDWPEVGRIWKPTGESSPTSQSPSGIPNWQTSARSSWQRWGFPESSPCFSEHTEEGGVERGAQSPR